MYPIQCKGGFSIPIKGGKFRIAGIEAVVSDPTADSQLAIVDDRNITGKQGFVLGTLENQTDILCNIKGLANMDATIGIMFPNSISTRNGISAFFTNIVAGSTIVYVE